MILPSEDHTAAGAGGRGSSDGSSGGSQAKTLYLIDALAQLFRAYHAIGSNLTSPVTQEPTNAVYGWTGMLLKVIRDYHPDYLVIATDVSGDRGTFRSEIDPQYKANREAPPMDFSPQVGRSLGIARLMGIPVIGVERFEADDVIASLVRRLRESRAGEGLHIRIVSKDKDLEQLLSDRVELFDVHKDQVLDVRGLLEKKRIEPRHVRDVLALMGDTADNVQGVPGIGPKTAALLVAKYGSIEGIYQHIHEIKGKRREQLEKSREIIKTSRTLVTLRDDLEFDFDLEQAAVCVESFPVGELCDLFHTLGFHRYRDELREMVGSASGVNDENIESGKNRGAGRGRDDERAPEGSLFAQLNEDSQEIKLPEIDEPKRGKYELILSEEELRELVGRIERSQEGGSSGGGRRIAIDTETTSVDPVRAELCGVSISLEEGSGYYIPVDSPEPERHMSRDRVLEIMRPVLEDVRIAKVGQNLKYDWIIFRNHGVRLNGITGDSMIAAYLFDSSRSSYSLDALAHSILDYRCIPISRLIGERRRGKTQLKFNEVPLDVAGPYAAEDADVALRLVNYFEPKLAVMGLGPLYDDIEIPLVEVLASMQYEGIRVDPDLLDEQRGELNTRIEELREMILKESPREFNPDSPKQLAGVLFNSVDDGEAPGLGLKVFKRRKTGPSTDMEVLEKLADDPEVDTIVPKLIVEYRQLRKLVNTYLGSLKDCIYEKTSRVHASFNQTVAATGRLSSSNPNLQNIPIRTEVGRRIRKAFVAKEDYQLITADYSQIELRLLAHLSGDEALVQAFRSGEDIHQTVAAQVYGVTPSEVTSEQRSNAKMVNFGIVYGITPFGLARRLGAGVTNEQAAQIIDDYKKRFPGIDRFLKRCVEEALQHGFVETIMKRRRAVPQVRSRNPREKMLGERMAINSVVQGSAADLIKIAMVNLYRKLPTAFHHTRMLLQIHDELVFESPVAEVENALKFIVGEMEGALDLKVPLKVNAEYADNWLEGK